MPKGFSIRKPSVRLTKNGLRVTKPSVRVGGKAGVNISSSGVSASLRTKGGTINTKKGCSRRLPFFIFLLAVIAMFARKHTGR